MNLQYISDSEGKTTGVFIPIEEWNLLKKKYNDFGEVEMDIPQWHKKLVRSRIDDYKKNPGSAMDFDDAMDDIDNKS